jgi:DNA-binding transcriptional ArsR family regulator
VNTGIGIVVHGETVRLEITTDSDAARRELGVVAWSVLEVLALVGQDADRCWVATTNARDLATRLGIGKDRVAAALGVLRQAGLVVAHTNRDARSARFAASCYEVRLAVSRVDDAGEVTRVISQPDTARTRSRVRDASPTQTLDLFSSAS